MFKRALNNNIVSTLKMYNNSRWLLTYSQGSVRFPEKIKGNSGKTGCSNLFQRSFNYESSRIIYNK